MIKYFVLVACAAAALGCTPKANPDHSYVSPPARCDTDSECAFLPECLATRGCDGGPQTTPMNPVVLVGYECDGVEPTEVVLATEEDMFPDLDGDGIACKRIEATPLVFEYDSE